MEDSLSTNNLVKMVVAVLLAVIMVGVVMMPIVESLGEEKEQTVVHTITNNGVSFALANADSESHPIIMSVDGDKLIVTSDGSPVSTGLGNVLPSVISDHKTGPFNTYYVAINLASGDNSDDAGETRLSKEKGEVAYLLNTDNLHQTSKGYTFDPTLYNVMLVIPPVYWYSELDSGSTETGKLYMASSPDAFVSMGITADKLKDYAHTYTSGGVVGHAPAIAIAVYEAYNDNGVLVSQSGRTPTASTSLRDFVPLATAGNTDNAYGTYQLWNYYMWTLYRMMGFTVMGNMDSQYMMGQGPTNMSASSVTGLTSSAYEKSANAQSSVSLFLENTWGSVSEFVGDTTASNYVLSAGNTLGGSTSSTSITNVLGETVTLPTSSGQYYATFNPSSEVFGAPATVGLQGTAGQAIDDYVYTSSSTDRALVVGGTWTNDSYAGLSWVRASSDWTNPSAGFGARLAYLITDSQYSAPVGATGDYAYILSYNTNGTVSDVQSIEDGVATSYMPDGTTLNSYWDFEPFAILPQLSDATDSVDLAVGSDSILQFYNSGNVVLQTATGTVDLGRVNDVTPTPVTVTVQNGVMTYTEADSTVGTVNNWIYRSDSGEYVLATVPVKVLNDNTSIYFGNYAYGIATSNDTVDIGYVGSFTASSLIEDSTVLSGVTVIAPSDSPVSTTATVNSTSDEHVITISSVVVESTYSDDSSIVTYNQMFAPKSASWEETIIVPAGGIAYTILTFVPVLIVLGVLIALIVPYLSSKFETE